MMAPSQVVWAVVERAHAQFLNASSASPTISLRSGSSSADRLLEAEPEKTAKFGREMGEIIYNILILLTLVRR